MFRVFCFSVTLALPDGDESTRVSKSSPSVIGMLQVNMSGMAVARTSGADPRSSSRRASTVPKKSTPRAMPSPEWTGWPTWLRPDRRGRRRPDIRRRLRE